MALALEGIKVLDVAQVAAVPMAARHLADFGADVLHIENPTTGDSWRSYQADQQAASLAAPSPINYNWENYNRNKRSVTIDLSRQSGQEIMYRLVEQADVLVTNLRPFELKRFRLEYPTLSKLNPRLVFGALTGYGKKGPEKDAPAYDATALWARSGIPYMLTMPGLPGPGFRPAFGDNVAALALAYGVMLALFVRERTGLGQEVDISLFHTGLYQLSFDVAGALATGLDYADWRPQPPQELIEKAREVLAPISAFYRYRSPNPLAGAYITKDMRVVTIIALQPDRYWARLCQAIGRDDLIDDPRFSSFQARADNRGALYQILDGVFLTATLEEWKQRLQGIPFAPMQSIKEAVNDPQADVNEFFVPYEHPEHGQIRGVANPVKLSNHPATVRRPAPEFGQHTEEVLLEAGYSWEDIARFKEEGAIA
jgi:crotonobetainyl-CoA:carnitine CoA-transferase CaiB-like acyl-CoA transferase